MLGLCHSMFEDTLVMMLLGGHVSGVFWGRLLFSLLAIWLLCLLVKRLPQSFFERYLVRRTIVEPDNGKGVNCC